MCSDEHAFTFPHQRHHSVFILQIVFIITDFALNCLFKTYVGTFIHRCVDGFDCGNVTKL